MRSTLTSSEALLWAQLKRCQLGVAFRRQVIVDRHIADFAAPLLSGEPHHEPSIDVDVHASPVGILHVVLIFGEGGPELT